MNYIFDIFDKIGNLFTSVFDMGTTSTLFNKTIAEELVDRLDYFWWWVPIFSVAVIVGVIKLVIDII